MITPTRISNAAALGLAYTEVQYPSKSPFNCDCSRLLLLEPQNFSLWTFNGTTYTRNGPLTFLGDASEPLWSRTDPATFYYHTIGGNTLYAYNVSGSKVGVHTFSEYSVISGLGESALSEDGNHIVLIGDNRYVFTYNIATGVKGNVLDLLILGALKGRLIHADTPRERHLQKLSAKASGTVYGLDSLYITPNNNVLISWSVNGTARYNGIELFDSNMNFLRQAATANGHKGVMRDADGSEIMIWTNSAENPVTTPAFQNGIIKVRLADASQTGLLSLDWSLAVHISCPRKTGYAIVETYDPTNPVSTKQFANAVLQVPLNGSATTQLLKHGSNSSTYDGQPRTSVSDDGSRFAYGSNKGVTVTDAYFAVVGAPVPPPPTPFSGQMFYQDARGGGKLSYATFLNGICVGNVNLP